MGVSLRNMQFDAVYHPCFQETCLSHNSLCVYNVDCGVAATWERAWISNGEKGAFQKLVCKMGYLYRIDIIMLLYCLVSREI